MHSVVTIDYVADMSASCPICILGRAILKEDTDRECGERGSVLVSRLRLGRSIPDSDVFYDQPFLSPMPLFIFHMDSISTNESFSVPSLPVVSVAVIRAQGHPATLVST